MEDSLSTSHENEIITSFANNLVKRLYKWLSVFLQMSAISTREGRLYKE